MEDGLMVTGRMVLGSTEDGMGELGQMEDGLKELGMMDCGKMVSSSQEFGY